LKVNGTANKLQALLEAQIGKGSIKNIVASVQAHDRSLDFTGAAGVADPLTGAAMTPDTSYFIASITKMYTAAIILHLYEQKRLDLDAPISKYLPGSLTRAIHVYKGTDYSQRILVSQLLDQSSGLADYEADKPRPLPEFIGHSGSTGSFAFTCPSKSLYLAGTVNQIASPAKPFFLMIDLVRAAS
jgi:CubicO group peptidase (beta-lactamase class C family)